MVEPEFGQPEQWGVECMDVNLIFHSGGRTDTLQERKTEIQNALLLSDVSIDSRCAGLRQSLAAFHQVQLHPSCLFCHTVAAPQGLR